MVDIAILAISNTFYVDQNHSMKYLRECHLGWKCFWSLTEDPLLFCNRMW